MVTLAIILRQKKWGHVVNIRLTYNRKSVFVSLGHKVDPSLFNSNAFSNWVHGRHPDAIFINADIEKKRKRAVSAIAALDDEVPDLQHIADIIKGKVAEASIKGSFLQAISDRSLQYYNNNQTGSYYKYKALRIKTEEAWGRDYSPHQITVKLVEDFKTARKKEGIHNNTIRKELNFLSTCFKAVCKGPNPFSEVTIVAVPTHMEKLNKDEIKLLEDADLTDEAGLARDMFLFSYYAQGMRFQNVALMPADCIKNGLLVYQMNKGQKYRELEVHPKLLAIIEKYKGKHLLLFPVIKKVPKTVWEIRDMVGAANTIINRDLKIAAAGAGVKKKLKFHMARHSFSYSALQYGASYAVLKDALGHSDFRTTQGYLDKLSDDHINDAVRGMFD